MSATLHFCKKGEMHWRTFKTFYALQHTQKYMIQLQPLKDFVDIVLHVLRSMRWCLTYQKNILNQYNF